MKRADTRQYAWPAAAVIAMAGALAVPRDVSADMGNNYFYLGGGYGVADFDDASNRRMGQGGRVTTDQDNAWRAFGGLRRDNVAFELGYIDFNDIKGRNDAGRVKGDAWGIDFSAVGYLPINNEFSLFAKAGPYYWNSDVSSRSRVGLRDKSSVDVQFGLGAQLEGERIGVRAEWTHYLDLYDSVDTNTWMGSVFYKF